MRVDDFSFSLPEILIARYPSLQRRGARLLSLNGNDGGLDHGFFPDILKKINKGDLLVFNDTRVIPARLYGRKATGGKIEMLVERILDDHRVLAHVRASKSPKTGSELWFGKHNEFKATTVSRLDELFEIRFQDRHSVLDILDRIGCMPLPPYVDRPEETADRERYQTVYSRHPGAVAAPTAGLHFDDDLLDALREKGVEMAFVTLHIGAGTFQPVRVERIEEHQMHAEYVHVTQEVVDAVLACKRRGNRVVAVGTTSVRSLESAAQMGENASDGNSIAPFFGDTRIFIYPGYHFRIVDALITNFHLPASTLLMLVSAFAGYQNTMNAYQEAVAHEYRFFSYGDAMFITRTLDKYTEKE